MTTYAKPTNRRALSIVPVLLLSLLTVSCSFSGNSPEAASRTTGRGGGGGAAVPVVTAPVVTKAVPVTLPAVGTVEAISMVQIRAQVTGQLSAIHFAEGQDVRANQPLFTIDPRPFEAALQQTQAVLERDTAT